MLSWLKKGFSYLWTYGASFIVRVFGHIEFLRNSHTKSIELWTQMKCIVKNISLSRQTKVLTFSACFALKRAKLPRLYEKCIHPILRIWYPSRASYWTVISAGHKNSYVVRLDHRITFFSLHIDGMTTAFFSHRSIRKSRSRTTQSYLWPINTRLKMFVSKIR